MTAAVVVCARYAGIEAGCKFVGPVDDRGGDGVRRASRRHSQFGRASDVGRRRRPVPDHRGSPRCRRPRRKGQLRLIAAPPTQTPSRPICLVEVQRASPQRADRETDPVCGLLLHADDVATEANGMAGPTRSAVTGARTPSLTTSVALLLHTRNSRSRSSGGSHTERCEPADLACCIFNECSPNQDGFPAFQAPSRWRRGEC